MSDYETDQSFLHMMKCAEIGGTSDRDILVAEASLDVNLYVAVIAELSARIEALFGDGSDVEECKKAEREAAEVIQVTLEDLQVIYGLTDAEAQRALEACRTIVQTEKRSYD